ncbi:hypothetical protein [Acinetobacter sp. ANC 5502]
MKKLIVLGFITLALVGCGKSQAEIEKEKQAQIAAQKAKIEQEKKLKEQAEIKATEEIVKYYLKDGESARFRNVIKNCGEVNAKNSWGAYSGFSRFIVRDDKQVIFDAPDNQYFNTMVQLYCHKDYLTKFPVNNPVGTEETAAAADAAVASDPAPSIAIDEIPTRSRKVTTRGTVAEATAAASEAAAAASDATKM